MKKEKIRFTVEVNFIQIFSSYFHKFAISLYSVIHFYMLPHVKFSYSSHAASPDKQIATPTPFLSPLFVWSPLKVDPPFMHFYPYQKQLINN